MRRELRDAKRAPVFLSSASDPYQPVEAKYKLARRCLEELRSFGFPVVILTRSPLVLRDLDILRKMEWVRVGCSISTGSGRFFEPGVPPLNRRLETLRSLAREGIETWVSFAPVIPGVSREDVEGLVSMMRDAGVKAISAGLLRFQGYDVSKRNFELATGMSADEILGSGEEAISEAREAISKAGFGPSEEIFRWEEPRPQSLDAFTQSGPPAQEPLRPGLLLPA